MCCALCAVCGDHSSHVQGVLYTDGRGADCAGCVEPGVKPVSHPTGAQMGMNNRVVCCVGADLVLAVVPLRVHAVCQEDRARSGTLTTVSAVCVSTALLLLRPCNPPPDRVERLGMVGAVSVAHRPHRVLAREGPGACIPAPLPT